jgi:hypothetical protein
MTRDGYTSTRADNSQNNRSLGLPAVLARARANGDGLRDAFEGPDGEGEEWRAREQTLK